MARFQLDGVEPLACLGYPERVGVSGGQYAFGVASVAVGVDGDLDQPPARSRHHAEPSTKAQHNTKIKLGFTALRPGPGSRT